MVHGRGLSERQKPTAGSAVHYGFGAAMGITYGILAAASRVATVGWGMGFGAAVWLGAHVIMVPALGLAPPPARQPLPKEGLELGMHLLYGVTVHLVRRVALRLAIGSPRATTRQ
jgi:putative membrane protein